MGLLAQALSNQKIYERKEGVNPKFLIAEWFVF